MKIYETIFKAVAIVMFFVVCLMLAWLAWTSMGTMMKAVAYIVFTFFVFRFCSYEFMTGES